MLDTGARGATTTFVQRGIGDVLIAWENEALLALKESDHGEFEMVVPSLSILAEPPVTWVDKVVNKRGTRALWRRPTSNTCIRRKARKSPRNITIGRGWKRSRSKYAATFPKVSLFTIDEVFGGWQKAQKTHFIEGGVFDQIFRTDSGLAAINQAGPKLNHTNTNKKEHRTYYVSHLQRYHGDDW